MQLQPTPCYICWVWEADDLIHDSAQFFSAQPFSAPSFAAELWSDGRQAGVDEVGIGPLAGPVYAAAVILNPMRPVSGLADSKAISEGKRKRLAAEIKCRSHAWAIASASEAEIDRMNILAASHLAMRRAVAGLGTEPTMIYVDGNKSPHMRYPVVAVVKGDRRVPQISAASILAKVARDELMVELDSVYPGYGFARHKGYPTRAHFAALQELGPSPVHRQSFAPVQACLNFSDGMAAGGPGTQEMVS